MYSSIFRHILNPFFEGFIKHRKMLDYRKFLDKSQWWTREELLKVQWTELQKLLEHTYANVPYWQDVFKKSGLTPEKIKNYSDFVKLPITLKDDIRASKERMIAGNYKGKTWTKTTGGSTGVPLELDYTPESYDWRVAVSKRGYSWAGCEDGMKQAYIWGTAIGEMSRLRQLKENIHYAILRQKYFNCFDFTEEKMVSCLEEINCFKPKIIVGYTNPLYNFAQFVGSRTKVKFQPKGIISAAEKLHEFQREKIKEVFGASVFNTYGSREFMLIASECEQHQGLHINIENLFVEVVDERGTPVKPGEAGDILITDLHNYGMPFIRYKIGDMAIASDRECPCGRGLPLFEDVVGRSLDMIKTPDGRSVPGEFFPHLMKEFKGINRFQVIQNELNRLKIKIIKDDKLFNDADFKFMKNEIIKVMGEGIEIDFDFVDDIPLTKTGKFRVTISNI
ncbi:FIG00929056: hypothetical protein [hydrothermal vent metagenome]|uniref:Capsular polysaccharide biosynthesis protein n=1 Tax=hydrothermal vent metagenome TaxID=652676 RepID=A0A3B1CY94_9ZZZZ